MWSQVSREETAAAQEGQKPYARSHTYFYLWETTLDSCAHTCNEVRQKIFHLTVLGYTMPTILGQGIYETDSQTGICKTFTGKCFQKQE